MQIDDCHYAARAVVRGSAHRLMHDQTGWRDRRHFLMFCTAMTIQEQVARHLAAAFVCGRWQIEELVERGGDACEKGGRWLRPLVQRLMQALGYTRRPSRWRVLKFLRQDPGLRRACVKHELRPIGLQWRRPEMAPADGRPTTWQLPPLVTIGELADWLDLRAAELDWFADARHLERHVPEGPLRHYRYYWLSKRLGGSARLVEAPKWRLKTIQRRILHEILEHIPLHPAASTPWAIRRCWR